jgi:hypothetical protein
MSALPQRFQPPSKPVVRIKRREGVAPANQDCFLQPLLQRMIQSKTSGQGEGVFAFCGPTARVGVSYVVQLVAHELALESRGRVLIASAGLLDGGSREHLRSAQHGYMRRAPSVWSLVDMDQLNRAPDFLLDHIWLDLLPEDFDYILIDCPAVNEAGDALRVAPDVDGIFMVVSAGETRRDQIEHAQRMLRYASDRYDGLILNRRTYPVPKFLYKFL